MTLQHRWRALLPKIAVSIAVILFSTAGIAAIMGWRSAVANTPEKLGEFHDSVRVVETTAAQRRAKARGFGRCAECGLIVSMGEINPHGMDANIGAATVPVRENGRQKSLNMTTKHETIVRMADGSNRVINGMNPVSWRVGERVIVIAGTAPARQ